MEFQPQDFTTDALVLRLAVSENTGAIDRKMHASPSGIGKIASEAGTDTLVFGHFNGAQPGRR